MSARRAVLAALVLVTLGGPVIAAEADDAVRVVEVRVYRGLVTVETAPGPLRILEADLVAYDGYRAGGTATVLDELPLQPRRDGDRWIVEGPSSRELQRVRIQAPADRRVLVEIVHFGEVRLAGRRADAEIRIFQGRVTLEDHRGSASVTVQRDGEIRATLPEVRPSGPSAFNVFRGTIELWLPSNVQAALETSSIEGTVDSEIAGTTDTSSATILVTNVKGAVRVRAIPARPEE